MFLLNRYRKTGKATRLCREKGGRTVGAGLGVEQAIYIAWAPQLQLFRGQQVEQHTQSMTRRCVLWKRRARDRGFAVGGDVPIERRH